MIFDPQLQYKIGITLIKGIGNVLAKNLIAYLGNVEAIFSESPKRLAKIPGIGELLAKEISQQDVLKRADKEVEFILKNGITPIYHTDQAYPFRLKECADSPIMLYAKSNTDLNTGRYVGVVGTRNATEYGKELCKSFLNDLASTQPDVCIVSGLAYGIDICAHKAALDFSSKTIAVIGHGLDRIYPATHRSVAVKMLENGGLLTEYLSETNPDRQNFVMRNRIIAGMCDAIVVVESGSKGGSLITANLAQSYNRDVFAFPGRVGDDLSAGCNQLIKSNKAALIESATDLEYYMGWEKHTEKKETIQPALFVHLTAEQQTLVSYLHKEKNGLQMNQLAISLGMPISKISSMLLELEFSGVVKCSPGNVYKLAI